MEYSCLSLLAFSAVLVTLVHGDESSCVVDETSSLRVCFDALDQDWHKGSNLDVLRYAETYEEDIVAFQQNSLVVTLVHGDETTCVVDETSSLRVCFDALRDDLRKTNPADVNDFLCGNPQKERVECIIKKFKICPEFKNETFLDELKHSSSGFHSKDLFSVDSADQFCQCAPIQRCMNKINTDQMVLIQRGDNVAWTKMPNTDYICGSGKPHLECVAESLPQCDMYLQHKYNQKNADKDFDVTNIEHAAMFAKKRCGDDRVIYEKYTCANKRAQWHALEQCARGARLYKDDEDRSCGLRRCIDINFATCEADEIEYFVDGINVFSDNKVQDKPCSASTSLLATVYTVILAIYSS